MRTIPKVLVLFVVLLQFFACDAGCLSAGAAEPSSGKRCVKVLYSSATLGVRNCLIGPDCVRVENPKSGVTIVCAAPDYTVYSYNVRSKLYFQSGIENFPGEAYDKISSADTYTLTKSPWTKLGRQNFKDRSCQIYKMKRSHKAVSKSVGSMMMMADYLVSEDIVVAPPAQKLLAKVLHLPYEPGVPMMLRFFDQDDGWVMALTCRRIEAVTEGRAAFVLPVGYKPSKNEGAVFVDPMSKSVFQGLNDFTEKLAH